jgi:hypothetical protein
MTEILRNQNAFGLVNVLPAIQGDDHISRNILSWTPFGNMIAADQREQKERSYFKIILWLIIAILSAHLKTNVY